MKYLFYPIIVIAAVVAIYVYILTVISKIYFKFDLSGIKLTELGIGGIGKVNIKINSYIENLNDFRINFSDLFVQLFYQNELIATSTSVDTNKYTIPSKGKFNFIGDMNLFINTTTINIVKDIIAKKPVSVDYIVNVKVFNIAIPPIKDSFTI